MAMMTSCHNSPYVSGLGKVVVDYVGGIVSAPPLRMD
jgi:hypothetical protein